MNKIQLRLTAEVYELNEKLTKLKSFMTKDEFRKLSEETQILLAEQAYIMSAYISVLSRRIMICKDIKEEDNE